MYSKFVIYLKNIKFRKNFSAGKLYLRVKWYYVEKLFIFNYLLGPRKQAEDFRISKQKGRQKINNDIFRLFCLFYAKKPGCYTQYICSCAPRKNNTNKEGTQRTKEESSWREIERQIFKVTVQPVYNRLKGLLYSWIDLGKVILCHMF